MSWVLKACKFLLHKSPGLTHECPFPHTQRVYTAETSLHSLSHSLQYCRKLVQKLFCSCSHIRSCLLFDLQTCLGYILTRSQSRGCDKMAAYAFNSHILSGYNLCGQHFKSNSFWSSNRRHLHHLEEHIGQESWPARGGRLKKGHGCQHNVGTVVATHHLVEKNGLDAQNSTLTKSKMKFLKLFSCVAEYCADNLLDDTIGRILFVDIVEALIERALKKKKSSGQHQGTKMNGRDDRSKVEKGQCQEQKGAGTFSSYGEDKVEGETEQSVNTSLQAIVPDLGLRNLTMPLRDHQTTAAHVCGTSGIGLVGIEASVEPSAGLKAHWGGLADVVTEALPISAAPRLGEFAAPLASASFSEQAGAVAHFETLSQLQSSATEAIGQASATRLTGVGTRGGESADDAASPEEAEQKHQQAIKESSLPCQAGAVSEPEAEGTPEKVTEEGEPDRAFYEVKDEELSAGHHEARGAAAKHPAKEKLEEDGAQGATDKVRNKEEGFRDSSKSSLVEARGGIPADHAMNELVQKELELQEVHSLLEPLSGWYYRQKVCKVMDWLDDSVDVKPKRKESCVYFKRLSEIFHRQTGEYVPDFIFYKAVKLWVPFRVTFGIAVGKDHRGLKIESAGLQKGLS
eukprot:jgi/Mesen1/679/ME000109S_10902